MGKQSIEELARQERLEYFRNWRSQNKDKIKKHNDDYWKRKAMERIAKDGE